MSLLPSEVARLKYELGFNVLAVGADPYIGVAALFETVIQPYVLSGASTTSSTSVIGTGQPTLATLILADATGFDEGAAVIVDVDSLQERATVRHVAGAAIEVLLSRAHAGTYPVTVEGGESIIRSILQRLVAVGSELASAAETAGIRRIDEIEFFGGAGASDRLRTLRQQRDYWRDELASVLGIERLNRGGVTSAAVY